MHSRPALTISSRKKNALSFYSAKLSQGKASHYSKTSELESSGLKWKCPASSSNNRELMNGKRHKAYATTKSSPPTHEQQEVSRLVGVVNGDYVRIEARKRGRYIGEESSFRHRLLRTSFTLLVFRKNSNGMPRKNFQIYLSTVCVHLSVQANPLSGG